MPKKFYIVTTPVARFQTFGKRSAAGYLQWYLKLHGGLKQRLHSFFCRQPSHIRIIVLTLGVHFDVFHFLWIDKVADHLDFFLIKASLLHFRCHKLAWTDKRVRGALQALCIPFLRLKPCQQARRTAAFHTTVGIDSSFAAFYTLLAHLASIQAAV